MGNHTEFWQLGCELVVHTSLAAGLKAMGNICLGVISRITFLASLKKNHRFSSLNLEWRIIVLRNLDDPDLKPFSPLLKVGS